MGLTLLEVFGRVVCGLASGVLGVGAIIRLLFEESEVWVGLDIGNSGSVDWIEHQHLENKVLGFRHDALVKLRSCGLQFLEDLVRSATSEWHLLIDHLIEEDTHGPHIHPVTLILTEQYLR